MADKFLFEHVLGGLAVSLMGDAMGAASEFLSGPEQINKQFGGRITKFYDPAPGTPASRPKRKAGQITDDTSQALYMIQAYVDSGRVLKIEEVAKQMVAWGKVEVLFNSFAGPSTRKALAELEQGKSPWETGLPPERGNHDLGTSCGAAMKVAPAGLAHPGDIDAAIRDAITMSIPTHHTNVAFAGAAATAAAIAAGIIPGASILSVTDAAIYGAEQGYKLGKDHPAKGRHASVTERIKLAIEMAAAGTDFAQTCERLGDVIGCGLPIAEAVPVAVGLFVAARGDPLQSIIGAANLGGDSDSVGAIVGGIAGAYAGIAAVDKNLVKQLEKANDIDLSALAQQLIDLKG